MKMPLRPLGIRCLSPVLVLVVIWVVVGSAAAQPLDPLAPAGPDEPWHISADIITHDRPQSVYGASGNVVITNASRRLSADRVWFDQKDMTIIAEGNVLLNAGDDFLTGDRIELDLNNETGVLYNGAVFLSQNHFYIRGKRIEKTGRDTYHAEQASITSCDGQPADWEITGKDVRVTYDGYGISRHATLRVRSMPLLYTPIAVFPVKVRRQSGLLAPRLGYSNRKGATYEQPLFWAISDSADATFYYEFLEKRGNKAGLEARTMFSPESRATLMVDGLEDRQIDDGEDDHTKLWGYREDGEILRTNHDRYWLRMKEDQQLPLGFTGKLDLDFVSDQDYLRDFKDGYMGFHQTRRTFLDTFGRDIDDYDETIRENQLSVGRIWGVYSLNAKTQWYDDVIARSQDEADDTLQQLPVVTFDASKNRLGQAPLFFSLESEYARLYELDKNRAQRSDVHPRLYLPMTLGPYLTLEPSAGYRQTTWYVDEYPQNRDLQDRWFYRELYDFSTVLSTDIYRIFALSAGDVDRIKHDLRPSLTYDYIPEVDQSTFPKFNATDRIARKNSITYALTSTLTTRTTEPLPEGHGTNHPDTPAEPKHSYRQVLRAMLEQSYDINRYNERHPEPFSPLKGELDITPRQHLSIASDAMWSVYESRFDAHNVSLHLWDANDDSLTIEHRYYRNTSTNPNRDIGSGSVRIDARLRISNPLIIHGEFERDLYNHEDIFKGGGLTYTHQCWTLDLSHEVDGEERRTYFMIELGGLGRIGG